MPDGGGAVRVRRSAWDFRAVLDLNPHLLCVLVAVAEIGTAGGAAGERSGEDGYLLTIP